MTTERTCTALPVLAEACIRTPEAGVRHAIKITCRYPAEAVMVEWDGTESIVVDLDVHRALRDIKAEWSADYERWLRTPMPDAEPSLEGWEEACRLLGIPCA